MLLSRRARAVPPSTLYHSRLARLFFVALWLAALSGTASLQFAPAPTPKIGVDRATAIAGEPVVISGVGFAPGESVTVQVTHAGGAVEPDMGHEPSTFTVGADGRFEAVWTPAGADLGGSDLVATASGSSSGSVAPVPFVRVAVIAPDRGDYQPGDTAVLAGRGFAPGEVVKLQVTHVNGVNDGNGHEPFFVTANETGSFTATWFVDPDDSRGSKFRVAASGMASGVAGAASFWDAGAVSLTALGTAYTQTFDSLANTSTSSLVPTGWDFSESGTAANTLYNTGTGSLATGDTYSFGAAGNTERAFGGLRSGALVPTLGAQFTNNTGAAIDSLTLVYSGEMWRLGQNGAGRAPDRLDFQLSTDATSLTTGTWTDYDGLDLLSPVTAGTVGALNGNVAPNRSGVSLNISGLNIASGASFWIRWLDADLAPGSDDGLAIDDFSLTPAGLSDSAPSVSSATPGSGATDVPLSQSLSVTFSENVNAAGGAFALVCDTSGAHALAVSGGPATFTLDPDTDFASGDVCTLTVSAGAITDQDADDPPDMMAADFVASFTAIGPDSAPIVSGTVPVNGATNVALAQNLTVTFSEAVHVTEPWFTLTCSATGAHAAVVSGGPVVFTLNPATDFIYGESCTLVIDAAQVADDDGNDPPDSMVVNFTAGFGTTADPCTLPFTPIPAIQGSGLAPAITGPVSTRGVVVGDYEGPAPALRGFFIQDATGDGDGATSDGIFVFNGNTNSVSLGDIVQVSGTVGDFEDQTQISGVTSVTKCGTGSVVPADVVFPVASSTFLERYEGMLVRVPQTMSVTEHFQLGRFGQVVLSSDGRLPQPTNVTLPGAPALALQAQNNLRKIILDDEVQSQNPDPIPFARGGQALSASNTLRGGDTATGIVGVLNYTWAGNVASGNAYRIRPVNALNGYVNFEATNERPSAVPDVGGTVKVVGMNLLNFFNTFTNCRNGVGGPLTDCRGADNQAEFDRQHPKTVAAILALNPDVLGVNELENDGYGPTSALQFLVDRLNAATAPGTFAFIDADANTGQVNAMGTDAIRVAMLYKPAVVTPAGQTAALNSVAFVNGGDSGPRSRASLAQAFSVNATGAVFVVDVNHLKSKGSVCDAPDAGDGQGNCNQVRVNAANELTAWLASDPTGTGDPDVLMIGDYNSYAREDPITAIKSAGFTNLIESYLGQEAYSYVFDGQWGYLDHALASASLVNQVTGVGDYHINADEPSVLDYNTDFKSANLQAMLYAPDQFRVADHDPVIVGLNPNAPPTVSGGGPYTVSEGGSVTLAAVGADSNGDGLTYAWDLDGDGSFETSGQSVTFSAPSADGPGDATVNVEATDPSGLAAVAAVTIAVTNVSPVVGLPVVAAEPSAVDAMTTAWATFTDPGPDAPYACTVDYGDGAGALPGAVAGNTCTGPAHAYTSVGSYTVTVNVTDKDGATGTKRSSHSVVYTFSGFFQPIDNPPALNRVKAGRAIPVRFSLNGNRGLNIFEAGYPATESFVCSSSGIDDIEETTNAAASSLSFNASTGQYTYVWRTEKAWVNTCRQLVLKFADGTIKRAKFRFVK